MNRAAEDAEVISRRIAEIRAEEDLARRGCECPEDDHRLKQHALSCPLRWKDIVASAGLGALDFVCADAAAPTGCASDCTHPSHRHGDGA